MTYISKDRHSSADQGPQKYLRWKSLRKEMIEGNHFLLRQSVPSYIWQGACSQFISSLIFPFGMKVFSL